MNTKDHQESKIRREFSSEQFPIRMETTCETSYESTMNNDNAINFNYDDETPKTQGQDQQGQAFSSSYMTPTFSNDLPDHSGEGEFHGDKQSVTIPVTKSLYLYAFCAALNSCNLGYDIGVNTGASKVLQKSMELSDAQLEIFMGSLNLFAMIGALCAQFISDNLGRRRAFQVSAFVFIFGLLVMSFSWSYASLLFGRIFVGLGVGFGLAIDPVYISEISPAAHRGYLVTWSEISINIGLLLGFSTSLAFGPLPEDLEWRCMFLVGTIMPTILIFLVWTVMPESPRWLVSKGRTAEATAILRETYPPGFPVDRIVKEIHETILREAEAEHAVGWDVILSPSPAFRRMLVVGIGTAISQQLVGIEAIQYYLLYIIEESGVENETTQSIILIFLGFLKLLFIFLAGGLFDKRGRRPLLFASVTGMTVALLVQSLNFMSPNTNAGLTIFSLAIYLMFFSIGMGPGCWLVPAEVFSTSIRAKAMSLATFSNRVIGTIMASTFLTIADALTWAGFFLYLALVSCLIFTFFYFLLPETKGRSLEDMTLYFAEIMDDRSILDIEKISSKNSIRRHGSEPALEMSESERKGKVATGALT